MYYGLDVHKKFIQVCCLSKDGKTRHDSRFPCTEKNLRKFGSDLYSEDKVVLEATFHSWKIYSLLCQSRATIVVANPNQVKAIAYARVKTDKVDAFTLAQLLRGDLIPEVRMPNEKTWEARQLISHRRFLGKQRTSVKNSIWGMLNRNMIETPNDDIFTKKARQWLRELELKPFEEKMLDALLIVLESIEKQMDLVDIELATKAEESKQLQLLMTIPGVGLTVASGMMAVIEDIERFKTSNQLSSYFGLVPRISQSAGKCFYGGITKEGTAYGRWLAIEAANVLAMSGSPLTATYHRIKHKKGHNIAVTALARKLIVLIWHMLKKNEPYRYAPGARTREKLRQINYQMPAMKRSEAAKLSIEEICVEAGLPVPMPAKTAEKRVTANNKRTITRFKKTSSQILGHESHKISITQ